MARSGTTTRARPGAERRSGDLTRPGWLPNEVTDAWRATRPTSITTSTTTTSPSRQRRSAAHQEQQFDYPVRQASTPRRAVLGHVPSARGTRHAQLLADQPRRRTRSRSLLPRQVPRPPRGRPDRLHPRGRQLRGGRRRRRSGRGRSTAPTPPAACRTANHTDNANMATPPDGIPPRMQMYLFHDPAASRRTRSSPATAATRPTSSTTSTPTACPTASSSTRTATRRSATSRPARWARRGATGTPWTSWSTRDFEPTPRADGDLRVGQYVGCGQDLIRTQPIDCPVGSTSAACPGTPGAGPGGYTYGDFGQIIGGPEVHADGEIWGETLWDLREALGSNAGRVARHPGDGAVAGEPVVPRHAQLDPAGRPRRHGGADHNDDLAGLRPPRHGLLRRRGRR